MVGCLRDLVWPPDTFSPMGNLNENTLPVSLGKEVVLCLTFLTHHNNTMGHFDWEDTQGDLMGHG